MADTGTFFFSREVATELCGALGMVSAPSSHLHDGMLGSQHIVEHQYISVEESKPA